MTNFEDIKRMTVEQFAEWLDGVQVDAIYGSGSTPEEWLEWLQAQSEERKKEMDKGKMLDMALDALEGSIEIIHEAHSHGNQVDLIGTIGGDAVHYRVYFKDGEIERIGCK